MKTHLLFTSLITENRRRVHIGTEKFENRNRVNIFLTVIESLNALPIDSADFFIEFDETTNWAQEFVSSQILKLPFKVNIHSHRLSTFEQWKRIALSEDLQSSEQLVLFANDDHVFVPSNLGEYLRCSQIQRQASREYPNSTIMVLLTHFPEVHAAIPIAQATKTLVKHGQDYMVPVITPIGAVLITPLDFLRWFESDFTRGQTFVNPENPFGPSLQLKEGLYIVPRIELFRHLDAYSHVGLLGWPYQVMNITSSVDKESDVFELTKHPWILSQELAEPSENQEQIYLVDSKIEGDVYGFAASITKASAIRPSIQSIRLINIIYSLDKKKIVSAVFLALRNSRNLRGACLRLLFELPILLVLLGLSVTCKPFYFRLRNSDRFSNLLGASSFGLFEFYILGRFGSLKKRVRDIIKSNPH